MVRVAHLTMLAWRTSSDRRPNGRRRRTERQPTGDRTATGGRPNEPPESVRPHVQIARPTGGRKVHLTDDVPLISRSIFQLTYELRSGRTDRPIGRREKSHPMKEHPIP